MHILLELIKGKSIGIALTMVLSLLIAMHIVLFMNNDVLAVEKDRIEMAYTIDPREVVVANIESTEGSSDSMKESEIEYSEFFIGSLGYERVCKLCAMEVENRNNLFSAYDEDNKNIEPSESVLQKECKYKRRPYYRSYRTVVQNDFLSDTINKTKLGLYKTEENVSRTKKECSGINIALNKEDIENTENSLSVDIEQIDKLKNNMKKEVSEVDTTKVKTDGVGLNTEETSLNCVEYDFNSTSTESGLDVVRNEDINSAKEESLKKAVKNLIDIINSKKQDQVFLENESNSENTLLNIIGSGSDFTDSIEETEIDEAITSIRRTKSLSDLPNNISTDEGCSIDSFSNKDSSSSLCENNKNKSSRSRNDIFEFSGAEYSTPTKNSYKSKSMVELNRKTLKKKEKQKNLTKRKPFNQRKILIKNFRKFDRILGKIGIRRKTTSTSQTSSTHSISEQNTGDKALE